MKRTIKTSVLSILTAFTFTLNVSASVLGSTKIDEYTLEIGKGLQAYHNVWYSDQSGVGKQTENYLLYTPNEKTEVVLTNGGHIYGTSTIKQEISKLTSQGTVPLAGTNADYFSFETGVPMSNVIVDGRIACKDETSQYAVGFLEDNSAFMGKMTIYTTLRRADGTLFRIHNVNKYRQPYSIYMFTDEFSTQTHNNTNGFDVILGSVEGNLKIGGEISAIVESVDEYNGSIAIPEGKLVLSVDEKAPEEYVNALTSLTIGEKVTITTGLEGDERFEDAKIAIGATGGMLIENGVMNSKFEAGANPRTALGIKADGTVILYTIDGRQKGYSYGVQLKSLATRLLELGCVDAINLDGGGSTSFALQFPGETTATVSNKPSGGYLRPVSNFLFFKNNLNKTGKPFSLTIYPLTSYVLTGATTQFSAKAADTAYYALPLSSAVNFKLNNAANSTITQDGTFTALDDGTVTLTAASGSLTATRDIVCVKTPTDIEIIDEATSKQVTSISLKRTEQINLTANAYKTYNLLEAKDNNFKWECDDNIGSIDSKGSFTAADVLKAEGNIYVTAGDKTVTLPVKITRTGNESDEELYTTLDVVKESDSYKIVLISNYGIGVSSKDIIVKADGKDIPYTLNDDVLYFDLPDDSTKVTVFVTNSEECTTFYTETISEKTYENPFDDTKGNWAEDIISYMYKNNIVNGSTVDGKLLFNPNKTMTRAEFSVMTANYLHLNLSDYKNVELPYADVNEIPSWALDSFKALYKLGIMQGSSNNGKVYANPYGNITRAETATLIARTLPDGVNVSEISATDKDDIPTWSAEGISKLIFLKAINGYTDGTIKPLNNVTKAESLKILYSIL